MGATACVVIPWFVQYLEARSEMFWKAMAWWMHDHLPCSEVMFCHNQDFNYGAFNIPWYETDVRRSIQCTVHRSLTKQSKPDYEPGVHASEYPGFPMLKPRNEHYAARPASLDTSHCATDSGSED